MLALLDPVDLSMSLRTVLSGRGVDTANRKVGAAAYDWEAVTDVVEEFYSAIIPSRGAARKPASPH